MMMLMRLSIVKYEEIMLNECSVDYARGKGDTFAIRHLLISHVMSLMHVFRNPSTY
jgi:hypothetical protein